MDIAVLVGAISTILGSIFAYILAVRKMSGRVSTTDAEQLWREAGDIRQDYKSRLIDESLRTRDLEKRVAILEGQNHDLMKQNFDCTNQIQDLKETVRRQEVIIETQEKTLKRLNGDA